jgi:hypothetical protein
MENMTTAPIPEQIQIRETADHVEVTGLSEQSVQRAVDLLRAAGQEQVAARSLLYSHVNQAMLDAAIPLVSSATQRQVQRSAALRAELLEKHGYETYASLAHKRQLSRASSARTWVSRERDKGTIFTVKVGGQTIMPAIQFTPEGQLNKSVADIVRLLLEAGLDGWSLWAWLSSPTGLLSGEVPSDVAETNPARALTAARRFAGELRRASSNVA